MTDTKDTRTRQDRYNDSLGINGTYQRPTIKTDTLALRTYKGPYGAFRACNVNCADGFKEDRKHGVIHGPYCDENGALYQNAEQASMAADFCAYCGEGR